MSLIMKFKIIINKFTFNFVFKHYFIQVDKQILLIDSRLGMTQEVQLQKIRRKQNQQPSIVIKFFPRFQSVLEV
jgi:hypothetical protein